MVESFFLSSKTGFNVAQAFSVCELSESHTAILFRAEKGLDLTVAVITLYASSECVPWKVVHEL